jgi:hypothetical protein
MSSGLEWLYPYMGVLPSFIPTIRSALESHQIVLRFEARGLYPLPLFETKSGKGFTAD